MSTILVPSPLNLTVIIAQSVIHDAHMKKLFFCLIKQQDIKSGEREREEKYPHTFLTCKN
jgi:hypothetical protein